MSSQISSRGHHHISGKCELWLRQEAEVRATRAAAAMRIWVRDEEQSTQDGLTGGKLAATG